MSGGTGNGDGNMARRDELEALLPFYLNGTLDGAELTAVEDWLASGEGAAALAEAELEFSGAISANEAIRPPADALSRFNRALDAEAGPAREPRGQSWLATAWQRVAGLPAGLAWATTAAAVVILLLQAVSGVGERGGNFEIAGKEGDLAKLPFALVVFKADARMADITDFLSDNGAAVIGGPTAGGVFRIAIPAETVADYDRIVGLIAAQPFAESVSPGRKPADGS